MKEQDIETLKKIIDVIYNIYKKHDGLYFDVEDYNYDGKFIQRYMEKYEIEDMEDFLNKFPYMKLLDYEVVYELQKYYNSEWLCAGWCCCEYPEEIINRFGNKGEK